MDTTTIEVRVYASALSDDPPVDTATFSGPVALVHLQAAQWCEAQQSRGLSVFEINQPNNKGA